MKDSTKTRWHVAVSSISVAEVVAMGFMSRTLNPVRSSPARA